MLGASALVTSAGLHWSRYAWADPVFSAYPFSLGVASGEPAPNGFVIWTRIAPKPLERGGGMPKKPVEVAWSVATDERMRDVVQKGSATAHPALGHAVHVELEGLQPARDYFYQFRIGSEQSRIGRARTLPPAGAPVTQVRFAAAGCQRYEDGYFTAYRRLAAERFDFVFHYGDYIYEYRTARPGERAVPVVRVMPGEPDECYTLDDYRHRYAVYKLDPDLQAAHASAPFVMSYDDHEVVNNWAGDTEDHAPPELFLLRRAAAFQAWYEHLPLRRAQMPRGPDIAAYRRFAVGDLVNVNVLDTRQYRSPQACPGTTRVRANCAEALDPARTMLGETQERWLYDSFRDAKQRWTLLAQQVTLVRHDRNATSGGAFTPSLDKWDGAAAGRDRLLAAADQAKLRNLIVVTGDIHQNWAGELKKNFADEKSATLGVEFVATSITSLGDGYDINDNFKAVLQKNPHMKFFNGQRGYVRHVVTPDRWQADYQVLDKVSVPDGRLSTRKSFIVENGRSALIDSAA
jgi:alkaline phosphatase D